MKIAGSTVTVFAAALTLLMILALLAPIPYGGREWGTVTNFAHVPVFALFAAFLMGGVLRWRKRNTVVLSVVVWSVVVWLAVIGFGILIEILQGFVGREPSWHDVGSDAVGAAMGTLWMLGRSADIARWRVRLAIVGTFLLVLALIDPLWNLADAVRQRGEMPLLSSFEQPLEMSRWSATDSRIRRAAAHATDGLWSLRVDLQPATYPGTTMDHPYGDWSGYDVLAMDVFLDGSSPLDLMVKIEDVGREEESYDRFERRLRLLPGEQQVRIALSDVAAAPRDRTMDLSRILRVQFFAVRLASPRTVFFDNLHLR